MPSQNAIFKLVYDFVRLIFFEAIIIPSGLVWIKEFDHTFTEDELSSQTSIDSPVMFWPKEYNVALKSTWYVPIGMDEIV